MNGLFLNFRYALRQLRKNLGLAAIAILTLALGIGTGTAMFGMLDAVLLRPIPFPDPDRLVRIFSTHAGQIFGPSTLDLRDYAAQNHTFEKMLVCDVWRKNVSATSAAKVEPIAALRYE